MQNLQRFNVLIGAILCIGAWAFAHFVLHAPEGWPRLVAFVVGAALFCLCAFAWKPSKPAGLKPGQPEALTEDSV